ncbi:penicillin-binding protein 1C [Dysgonomonas sp. PH5-45]|uniref:penicillin-binding protein 1C n=1 Tax=unclassified Dysgonomonas TaxID=2630389 RepID=UPI002476FC44|nr:MULTISPECIES: penicillin-binding protein 1C [unclassified Dysgonomonas]MDH6355676.1 penicillin-binding protein 1C [Dysgonomonas sp. PH5-45]MDH6388573.1 penicillin-binding protein 1C [Dysgonomonas sp. PH5-37]
MGFFSFLWVSIMEKAWQFIKDLFARYKSAKLRWRILIPLGAVLLLWYALCLPWPLFDVPYSTVVNDRNGELLGARIANDEQWRFPASDSGVPEKYKICLIEFEDRYFRYHWGVNPASVIRAIKQNLTQGHVVSGASTITMQTIRISRGKKRTFFEKLIEMIQATRLEFSYSKDEILSLYASHAPMGGNVVGIDAASWRYFGHDASQLSWAEAATLAVLPNSPSLMHFGRNRDKLLNKRNFLLKRLYEKGTFDKTDYDLATSEPLPLQPYSLPQTAPHLVSRLYMEQRGQNIRTTVDKHYQTQIENILTRWNAEFSQNGINNIAALVIDVQTNEVVSYCGNVYFERTTSANQVDIIQSQRSTGSILKPFLYCSMLQDGALLPNQLLPDIPISINGFAPKNFSLQYDGAIPASEALARSLNVPFVVLLRRNSVPKFYGFLQQAGLTTLNRSADSYGLSLILGGAEGRLWDITCMYARMAQSVNDFNTYQKYVKRNAPSYIKADRADNRKEGFADRNIFSAGASWLTIEALTNVNRPEEIDWRMIPSMQKIAWKTGTSFGARDGWAVGVNSRYAVGVWVGNSDGEGRPGLTGASTAGRVLFDIFNTLPKSPWFAVPTQDLRQVEVCRESGFLHSINCPAESATNILTCKKGTEAEVCPYHTIVHLSDDRQFRVFEDCAGSRGIMPVSWFVLPPSWEWYYKQQHPSYQTLPPFSPECSGGNATRQMDFIYPFPNAVISLPKQLDGSPGRVVFELAHRTPSAKVFWHLDGQYIGETQNFHKKEYSPAIGKHRLTVVDENGYTIALNFTVK